MSPPDELGDMLNEATGGFACELPRRAKKEQANVRKDEIATVHTTHFWQLRNSIFDFVTAMWPH